MFQREPEQQSTLMKSCCISWTNVQPVDYLVMCAIYCHSGCANLCFENLFTWLRLIFLWLPFVLLKANLFSSPWLHGPVHYLSFRYLQHYLMVPTLTTHNLLFWYLQHLTTVPGPTARNYSFQDFLCSLMDSILLHTTNHSDIYFNHFLLHTNFLLSSSASINMLLKHLYWLYTNLLLGTPAFSLPSNHHWGTLFLPAHTVYLL